MLQVRGNSYQMQGRKHLITNQLFKKLNVNLPGPTKQRCVPQICIYIQLALHLHVLCPKENSRFASEFNSV
jgi:hypothetical protein